jgi:hypothetical protein
VGAALWIAQLGLGLLFLLVGAVAVVADQRLAARGSWLRAMPHHLRQLVGVTEVACAVCLLSPALMRSDLAPLSAFLLSLAMAGTILYHHRHHDEGRALVGGLLFGICLFVAVGRFFLVPLF